VGELDQYPHAEYAFRVGDDIINSWNPPEVFFKTFNVVSRPIGLLHATYWCQAECYNGLLRQFFWNSAGIMAPEAVEGFVAIGQPRVADVVREAMASLGVPFPRDRFVRSDAIDSQPRDFFNSLDERFASLIEEEGGGFYVACERYAITNGLPPVQCHRTLWKNGVVISL
jgi:hypothetical protein